MLDAFISETVDLLCAVVTPKEVLVQRVMPQRTAEQTGPFDRNLGPTDLGRLSVHVCQDYQVECRRARHSSTTGRRLAWLSISSPRQTFPGDHQEACVLQPLAVDLDVAQRRSSGPLVV
jgi:hypothetical protein